jgi:hypothetical protein
MDKKGYERTAVSTSLLISMRGAVGIVSLEAHRQAIKTRNGHEQEVLDPQQIVADGARIPTSQVRRPPCRGTRIFAPFRNPMPRRGHGQSRGSRGRHIDEPRAPTGNPHTTAHQSGRRTSLYGRSNGAVRMLYGDYMGERGMLTSEVGRERGLDRLRCERREIATKPRSPRRTPE